MNDSGAISPSAAVPSFARRVVVADDSRTMRMMLSHALTRGGYDVRVVEDGYALLKALAEPDAPRLVISDWQMPGPDGVEICRELRRQPEGHRFYFLMVTANEDADGLQAALDAGVDDFIRKPVNPPELLARANTGHRVLELRASLEAAFAPSGAAEEVRTLRALLPVCEQCRRVYVVGDQKQRIEAYVREHRKTPLGQGLCDRCLEKRSRTASGAKAA